MSDIAPAEPQAVLRPDAHSRLSVADLRRALRRTPIELWRGDVTDWAAALTYYAILALLPTLLLAVSLVGLASPATSASVISHITAWAPAESGSALHDALSDMARQRSAALTVIVGSAVSALWSASSYAAVFRRALHAMHGVTDTRPVWRTVHRLAITSVSLLVLLVVSAVALAMSGSLAQTVGQALGYGAVGADVWALLRWPVLVALVSVLVLVLFRTGPPAARERRRTWVGGTLAGVLWLAASGVFTLYATQLGSYSKLYGSLAGIVVFLVWLWVSNLALLAGAQFAVEVPTRAARADAG
ncbi:YihY/virulence factor BrkB family protein [Streptomyces sp. SGAir0957]